MPKHILLYGCLLVVITITHVTSWSIWRECQPITVKKGLNVLNCSGIGLDHLSDLTDTAEVLDFSRNHFQELPNLPESDACIKDTQCRAFNNETHCRYHVSFSRNHINRFSEHALKSLRCLRSLDLSYNNITSSVLQPTTFITGAYWLRTLILKGNPLGKLPDDVITAPFMRHIQQIDLSHCDLTEIGENSIDDHSELISLDLSFNRLEDFKPATFKGLNKLKMLNLSNNRLHKLGYQVFADLDNLDYLMLSQNLIESFHRDAFYRDSRLKVMDLSSNLLDNIPFQALSRLTHLRHLIINKNPMKTVKKTHSPIFLASVSTLEMNEMTQLTKLDKGSLASFPHLVTLSIARNKYLKEIDANFLAKNASMLKEVHLENNDLYTLSKDALPWSRLTTLGLEGNPWLCDYRIKWMITANVVKRHTVICAGPPQVEGVDVKGIDPRHLQQPYTVIPIIAIITSALTIPVICLIIFCVWKRRVHCCNCCNGVRGRYVTVFRRDASGEGEDEVDIGLQARNNMVRLRAVSNGGADDTKPFINLGADDDDDDDNNDENEFNV